MRGVILTIAFCSILNQLFFSTTHTKKKTLCKVIQKSHRQWQTHTHTQQMLVSSLALLLLADVSTEASYELSWKPWLRLKKVLTLDNGWSAQSKTCLNGEWTWKRKSGTHTVLQWGSFCFCSVERCLDYWVLHLPSLLRLQWSEITVKGKSRRRVWGCSRITVSPHVLFISVLTALTAHRVQAIFEIRASLQATGLFLVFLFYNFFGSQRRSNQWFSVRIYSSGVKGWESSRTPAYRKTLIII